MCGDCDREEKNRIKQTRETAEEKAIDGLPARALVYVVIVVVGNFTTVRLPYRLVAVG